MGTTFLQQLLVIVLLALGREPALLLICDGAGWIRTCFTDTLADIVTKTMILDW